MIQRSDQARTETTQNRPIEFLQDRLNYDEEFQPSRRKTLVARIVGLFLLSGGSLLACIYGGAAGGLIAASVSSLLVAVIYPRHWWPAGAITLLIVVPFAYSAGGLTLSYLVPANLLTVAYFLASLGTRPHWRGQGLAIIISLFAIYCVWQIPFGGSDNNSRKLIWIFLLLFVVLMPSLIAADPRIVRPLVTMFVVCGAVISVIGMIEYASKHSVLADFYAASPNRLVQKWGDYRIFTIVGHPLVNATILSTVGTASIAAYLKWNARMALLVVALSGTAMIYTQSRTGIAALVVGVVLAMLGSARGRPSGRLLGSIVLISLSAIVFFQIENPLLQRNSSLEGRGSSELRLAYLDVLPDLMNAASLWGTGPGLSDSALRKIGGYAASFPIESSLVQWMVSFGILGFLLFASAVTVILITSMRKGAFIFPSMFAAYTVSACGFNLFEAFPSLIALPGILLASCIAEACMVMGAARSGPVLRNTGRSGIGSGT